MPTAPGPELPWCIRSSRDAWRRVNARSTHELFSPRAMMNRLYWNPPFRPAREEDLLTAMLQIHVGGSAVSGRWGAVSTLAGLCPGAVRSDQRHVATLQHSGS